MKPSTAAGALFLTAALGLLTSLAGLYSQSVPILVKDINPSGSGNPGDLLAVDNRLVFSADDGVNGQELWISDGTTDGTQMIVDIYPGPMGSFPWQFCRAGFSGVYFTADDGIHGTELWSSTLTALGTALAADISPQGGSNPGNLAPYGNGLVFSAADGVHGREPWLFNGTQATLILDIYDMPPNFSSGPSEFTPFDGSMFFLATDHGHGRELWRTNGTLADTYLVKDIYQSIGNGAGGNLVVQGGRLYFGGEGPGLVGEHYGLELWSTDGTEEGTQMVIDLVPGVAGSNPTNLTLSGSGIFYWANTPEFGSELWIYGAEGVKKVTDIGPGTGSSFNTGRMIAFQSGVVFVAQDPDHGAELWRSINGQGAFLLKDIRPGGLNSLPDKFTVVDGYLYFSADDGIHGRELWRTDGTEAGTELVADVWLGGNSSNPDFITYFNGAVFFQATTGIGTELWKIGAPITATSSPSLIEAPNLFPNPAGQSCRLEWPYPVAGTARLFGLGGRLWRQFVLPASSTVRLDIGELPAGIYILECRAGDRVWRAKLVKSGG